MKKREKLIKLFEVGPEGIEFSKVYLNGLHVLKRIKIKNLTNKLVYVNLETNLSEQITFQLRNENLPETEDLDLILNDRPIFYNEIFNHVEPITSILLKPNYTQSLVLGYLPQYIAKTPTEVLTDPFFSKEKEIKSGEIIEQHDYFITQGYINFRANIEHATKLKGGELDTDIMNQHILTIPFKSNVCLSVLDSDISNSDISFGSCAINGIYIRDFMIYNRSEIELEYCINFIGSAGSKWRHFFEFHSLPTGPSFTSGKLGPYQCKKVRMTFQPITECEFNLDMQIVNINDPSNFIECHLYAIVGELDINESPAISTNTHLLDYGDCYGGVWVNRILTIKNLSDSHLEILLSSSIPEVKFALTNDDIKHRTRLRRQDSSSNLSDNISEPTSANASKPHSPTSSRFKDIDLNSLILSENNIDNDINSQRLSNKYNRMDIENESETDNDSILDYKYQNHDGLPNTITYIEELVLKPGSEKTIKVYYRPTLNLYSTDFNAGKLIRNSFQIQLFYFKLENINSNWPNSPSFIKRSQKIKIIHCKARSCTSFIELLPSKLDFGDINIGMHKTLPVFIANHSDLTTQVELRYASKVISCHKGPFVITPNSSIEVNVTLFPRKINSGYRKQIVIANLNNPNNDQILHVQSNHVDKNQVTFHSLFYKIHTASGANFINLNSVIVNSPALSNFIIENISLDYLTLELSTNRPEEMYFFKINEAVPQSLELYNNDPNNPLPISNFNHGLNSLSGADLRESILEKMDDQIRNQKKGIKINSVSRTFNQIKGDHYRLFRSQSATKTTSYLDLADNSNNNKMNNSNNSDNQFNDTNSLKQIKKNSPLSSQLNLQNQNYNITSPPTAESSHRSSPMQHSINLTNSIFHKMEESMNQPIPLFPNLMAEEEYAKKMIQQRKDLETLIKEQVIIPIKKITIPPNSKFHIIFLFVAQRHTMPHLQGIPRTFNGKILIKLLEFDQNIIDKEFKSMLGEKMNKIPVRELMVKSLISKSIMELGQKNFNFGLIDKDDSRNKIIVLRNCSEHPLVFMLRKSGSIASGDLYFEGSKYGVIRGFGKKQVNLLFNPSLPGPFEENIIIRNVFDPDDDKALLIKALIRKPTIFSVEPLTEDFGSCYINELCVKPRDIHISNTHKLPKVFEVRVDTGEMNFGWCLGEVYFYVNFDEEISSSILTMEVEQKIETLEQKLKIAKRKGRDDKVKKIEDKLNRLRNGEEEIPGMEDDEEEENNSKLSSSDNNTSPLPSKPIIPQYGEAGYIQRTSNSVIFTILGSSRMSVSIYFKPIATQGLLECLKNGMITMEKELVSGQILIHEHRNRDVCKRVIFQATVNYNRKLYSGL
ncbi:hypothetical protein K502DRAFT_368962, partial [Neoconidiobolus thromboides FSU 785]